MVSFSLTPLRSALAIALLAGIGAHGCKKGASKSASTAEARPYGPTASPYLVTEDDKIEPLLHPPSAQELAKFPLDDRTVNLTQPIDWRQNPYKSRAWGMRVGAWLFMPPLLLGFDRVHDKRIFRAAVEIALDWVKRYPSPRSTSKNPFAWYDMAVASRATMLAYLVRTGGNAGLLEPSEHAALLEATLTHGEWLAAAEHYLRKHNHGLYSDNALLGLCKTLDKLKECEAWRPLARSRFLENLQATVSPSGVHLEHTPSYHFAIIRLLERRLQIDDDPAVRQIMERMRVAGEWLLQPDGNLPQLGDCHFAPGPAWAMAGAANLQGAHFFEDAGLYSMKTPTSQLLVTGAHNSYVHKHEDDLSFVLSEGKRRLFVDSGFLSYNKSPEHSFLKAATAHNMFLVDGTYVTPSSLPQRSLRAAGQGEGWYAVSGDDVHTLAGVVHERSWLYRPGKLLLVVERFVGEGKPHRLSRYFHLAPDVQTTPAASGVKLRAGELQAELFDSSPGPVEVQVLKGVRKRPMQGIVSEKEDELIDAPAVELHNDVGTANVGLLTVVELGARPARGQYRLLEQTESKLTVLADGQRLSLARAGNQLTISAAVADHR